MCEQTYVMKTFHYETKRQDKHEKMLIILMYIENKRTNMYIKQSMNFLACSNADV